MSSKSMVSEECKSLARVLERLELKYQEYLTCILSQRSAVTANKFDELTTCNTTIEVLSMQVQELEKRRMMYLEVISSKIGFQISNIQELSQKYNSEDINDLLGSAKKLKQTILHVKKENDINQELIKYSRSYLQTTVALFTKAARSEPSDKFKVYGNSGKYSSDKNSKTLINQRW
jgi:hypothetical protein